jgi:hypothetical protein
MNVTIQQAVAVHNQGKLKEAEKLYHEILKIEPNHLDANNNLGALFYKLQRLKEAEKSFRKAIELKSDFVDGHYNLAKTLLKLDKFEEAEKSFRKVIELKPDHTESYLNLGATLQELDKLDEAEKSYRTAIELNPDYTEAHSNLNLMLRQNEMFSEILKIRKNEKNVKLNFISKIYRKFFNFFPATNKLPTNRRLTANPFISNRKVEKELIDNLYDIDSKGLHETRGVFFGKGRHSLNFQLFDQMTVNNYSIIKKVEKDLINIMKQSVNSEVYIMDSFFHILKDGGGSVTHKHLSGFDKRKKLVNQKYSLSYYLSTGDQNCSEPGVFKLSDPSEEILPSEGTILIFPADRAHSAVYNGKTDRVMIGINFYSLL